MLKLNVKVDNTKLNARLEKQQAALAKLPKDGLEKFRQLTPIDTGNARERTNLRENNKVILADYAYAKRLDENWSRQTKRQGIIAPFTKWWEQQIKRIGRIK